MLGAIYNIGTVLFNKGAKEIQGQMNELISERGEVEDEAAYNALKAERDEILKQAKPYFDQVMEKEPDNKNAKFAFR